MANELRVRTGFIGGLIEDNPLTAVATTLTSASLASVPVIGSTQHMVVVFDPDGMNGAPEIAYITAHSASATTATIARGQESTTARAHDRDVAWVHSVTVKDFDASGGGSGLIGITSYNPAVNATPGTTSTTFTDVDATNLAVSFTVPPSGKVLIRLTSRAQTGTNTVLAWNVRESTTDIVGSDAVVTYNSGASLGNRCFHTALITGLTPGAAKTYKWGQARNFGGSTANTSYGGASLTGDGPAVMEVWAVNV